MRVFIPKGNSNLFISKEIISEPAYIAYFGFSTLGIEICFYDGNPPENLLRDDIVIGWISQVKMAISNLGINAPSEIDYPESLLPFLGRKVWKSTLHHIYTNESTWPVFVKPVSGKQFDGKLITKLSDLIGLGSQDDRDIWCSEPIKFVSEYRTFVRYNEILDCRRYKGDYKYIPNFDLVKYYIEQYKESPVAYTMDVGIVLINGKEYTYIIEINDAYSCGTYGLNSVLYAKFISARWCEIVGIPDPLLF